MVKFRYTVTIDDFECDCYSVKKVVEAINERSRCAVVVASVIIGALWLNLLLGLRLRLRFLRLGLGLGFRLLLVGRCLVTFNLLVQLFLLDLFLQFLEPLLFLLSFRVLLSNMWWATFQLHR